MPYIESKNRERYDEPIKRIVQTLKIWRTDTGQVNPGELNYVISSIVWEMFRDNTSYSHGNTLVGVLECVKQEFYRRLLALYEDEKYKENGDI